MGSAENVIDARSIVMTSSTGFRDLYERHHAAVYRAALRVTGNPTDAEDVLQSVFLRILNQSGGPDPSQMSEAYFRRAATNAAIDMLRRRVSHGESDFEDASQHAVPESPALLKEQLRRALAALDRNDALLFLLRHVEGLSNGELAEMFGLEKNNVAVRLHRIRQTLQAEMER